MGDHRFTLISRNVPVAVLDLGIYENADNWMQALMTVAKEDAAGDKCNCFLCQLMTVLVTRLIHVDSSNCALRLLDQIAQLLLINPHHGLEFLSKFPLESKKQMTGLERVLGEWLGCMGQSSSWDRGWGSGRPDKGRILEK